MVAAAAVLGVVHDVDAGSPAGHLAFGIACLAVVDAFSGVAFFTCLALFLAAAAVMRIGLQVDACRPAAACRSLCTAGGTTAGFALGAAEVQAACFLAFFAEKFAFDGGLAAIVCIAVAIVVFVHAFAIAAVAVHRISACNVVGAAVLAVGIGVDTEAVANQRQAIAAAEYAFAVPAYFLTGTNRRAVPAVHRIALSADAFAAAECLAVFRAVVLCFGVRSRTAARKCALIVIALVGTAYAAA